MENHDDSAGMKTEWALYGDNFSNLRSGFSH